MGAHLLTARQAEVWEMKRKQGLNLAQIARRLKIAPQSASAALKGALRKLTPEEKDEPLEIASPAERLAARFEELERAVADPSDAMALRLAQDLRVRALAMADNQVLAQANGPQLMQIAAGATNMIQLLNNKPTAITRFEDMRKLDEFLEDVSK